MGWLIDPAERSILLYPPGQQPELEEELNDLDFASNLQLTIGQIFNWLQVKTRRTP